MPYFGRDWRSPGDEWVKTKQGWEKLKLWRVKVFENLNSHFLSRLLRLALEEWDKDCEDLHNVHQPYIRFIRTTSKERKELTSISEALLHLDIATAGNDLRRFNYVCKLLRILLRDKLPFMSGTAQKYIFNIMEEMVNHVKKEQYNMAEMRLLVSFAAISLKEHHWDHIGSSCLWNEHCQAISRMETKLHKVNLKERSEDGKLTISDLPEECIRIILATIPDHADILRLGQTNTNNYNFAHDWLLWKQLCFFHFSKRQLLTFLNQNEDESQTDWKYIYKRCCWRFGKKDVYADMIAICCNCNNLYWQVTRVAVNCLQDTKLSSQKNLLDCSSFSEEPASYGDKLSSERAQLINQFWRDTGHLVTSGHVWSHSLLSYNTQNSISGKVASLSLRQSPSVVIIPMP